MTLDLNAVYADYEAWQKAHQAFDTDEWHLTATKLAGWVPDLLAALAAVEQDRDRLAAHSKTLNAIGFAAAIALGLVPPGIDQILADPIEQIRRLLDVTNPTWVSRDNLARANAHLAHAATMLAAEHSGTEAGQ